MELRQEVNDLLHEINRRNKEIFETERFHYLDKLCSLDISILAIISHYSGISAKSIGERLNQPKTTIVSAVKRLENNRMLYKIPNENDKRFFDLFLTEEGKKANYEHERYEELFVDFIVNKWDDKEELLNCLRKRRE